MTGHTPAAAQTRVSTAAVGASTGNAGEMRAKQEDR